MSFRICSTNRQAWLIHLSFPYLLGLEVAVLLLLGLRESIGELLTEPGVVGAAHLCSDLGREEALS